MRDSDRRLFHSTRKRDVDSGDDLFQLLVGRHQRWAEDEVAVGGPRENAL